MFLGFLHVGNLSHVTVLLLQSKAKGVNKVKAFNFYFFFIFSLEVSSADICCKSLWKINEKWKQKNIFLQHVSIFR